MYAYRTPPVAPQSASDSTDVIEREPRGPFRLNVDAVRPCVASKPRARCAFSTGNIRLIYVIARHIRGDHILNQGSCLVPVHLAIQQLNFISKSNESAYYSLLPLVHCLPRPNKVSRTELRRLRRRPRSSDYYYRSAGSSKVSRFI